MTQDASTYNFFCLSPHRRAGAAVLALVLTISFALAPERAAAMGAPKPQSADPVSVSAPSATRSSYRNGDVSFDLSRIYDSTLRARVLAALKLGYAQASASGRNVGRVIAGLRGSGQGRTIWFFSDPNEFGSAATAAPAASSWQGPLGTNDMDSAPSARTNLRVYMRPGQDYWYVVSNVWHELLHTTLRITHHYTTPEGTIPLRYVNDGVWYQTIKSIMFDFPRFSADPATGATVELYNPENNPWS